MRDTCVPMDKELAEALERARTHVMTPKEAYEQKVSWIYGMQKLSTPGMTIEQIKEHLARQGVFDPCPDIGEVRK